MRWLWEPSLPALPPSVSSGVSPREPKVPVSDLPVDDPYRSPVSPATESGREARPPLRVLPVIEPFAAREADERSQVHAIAQFADEYVARDDRGHIVLGPDSSTRVHEALFVGDGKIGAWLDADRATICLRARSLKLHGPAQLVTALETIRRPGVSLIPCHGGEVHFAAFKSLARMATSYDELLMQARRTWPVKANLSSLILGIHGATPIRLFSPVFAKWTDDFEFKDVVIFLPGSKLWSVRFGDRATRPDTRYLTS